MDSKNNINMSNANTPNINIDTRESSSITIDENITVLESKDSIWRYVVNACLIFGAVYGSIKCYISAFEIECYPFLLGSVLMVISVMYAFMHISVKIRKISYAFVFTIYITIIVAFRVILKSGFSRIINVTNAFLEKTFELPSVQRYAEYYEDRKMSVTLCLIIIGFVMGLVLNIVISEYMSVIGLLVVTLPIAQVGMYFDLTIDYMAYTIYVVTLLIVLEIKMTGKYNISDKTANYRRKKKKLQAFFKKEKNDKDSASILKFKTEPRMQVQIGAVCSGVTILVILLATPFVMRMKFFDDNEIKKNTKVYAKEMAMYSVDGSTYNESHGGVGGGNLGDVSVINNTNDTDLSVTFVPLDNKRVYLKGYIGAYYNDNKWQRLSEVCNLDSEKEQIIRNNCTEKIIDRDYNSATKYQKILQRMKVENIKANSKYAYLPYYTKDAKESIMDIQVRGEDYLIPTQVPEYMVDYYPTASTNILPKASDANNQKLKSMIYTYYLSIPLSCEEAVKSACETLDCDYHNFFGLEYDKNDNLKKQNIAKQISHYLSKNCKYSYRCGKTPKECDFVSYFLEKQKEGVCSHFATAATMMFRYMGIPARYIEGYVVDSENIEKADRIEASVDDYLEVKDDAYLKNVLKIDKDELCVKTVNVTDANAHAWVEIYINDFGWIPVEVTPASMGMPTSISDKISNTFSKIMNKIIPDGKKDDFKSVGVSILKMLGIVALVLIGIAVVTMIVYIIIQKYKKRSKIYNQNIRLCIKSLFEYMCKVFAICGLKKGKDETCKNYINNLVDKKYLNEEDAKELVYIVDEVNYSTHDVTALDEEKVRSIVSKAIKQRVSVESSWKKILIVLLG